MRGLPSINFVAFFRHEFEKFIYAESQMVLVSWHLITLKTRLSVKTSIVTVCYVHVYARFLWPHFITFSLELSGLGLNNWQMTPTSVVAADNPCKQFGPRSGTRMFDTLMVPRNDFL